MQMEFRMQKEIVEALTRFPNKSERRRQSAQNNCKLPTSHILHLPFSLDARKYKNPQQKNDVCLQICCAQVPKSPSKTLFQANLAGLQVPFSVDALIRPAEESQRWIQAMLDEVSSLGWKRHVFANYNAIGTVARPSGARGVKSTWGFPSRCVLPAV
jgi:hypothetical protein